MSDETEPLLVPIAEAAHLLGCCRATLYRMEKGKQLRIVRPFKRAMVPMSEINRITRGEPVQTPVGDPVGEPQKLRPKKVQYFPQLN